MNISAFYIVFMLSLSLPASGQSSQCSLKIDNSPTVRSFKLGMTVQELSSKNPTLKAPELKLLEPDVNGFASVTLNKSVAPTLEEYLPKIDVSGVGNISLSFLDNRLVKLRITYDGLTSEWGNVATFLPAIADSLKLPEPSNWRTTDKITRALDCDNFTVTVRLEPKLGRYEVESPSVTFSEAGLNEILQKRKETEKERQRKLFKP